MATQHHSQPIDLPSQGHFYDPENPLSSGQVEIKYMTAEHEDILTSRNLISKGLVIHKFLEAMIASPDVKYEDLLLGDKSAIILASRILGYGKDYPARVTCNACGETGDLVVDLVKIEPKEIDVSDHPKGQNQFSVLLPVSGKTVVFKLLTVKDELEIEKELQAMRKIKKDFSSEVTTRLRKCVLSVNGETEGGKIAHFVKTMPVRDSKAFRDKIREVTPDVDLTADYTCDNCGHYEKVEVAIDANFFWPDARL